MSRRPGGLCCLVYAGPQCPRRRICRYCGGYGAIPGYYVNEQIRAESVLLVAEDGKQIGVVTRGEALAKAQETGLDLVEVAPNLNPPVCRILDYGKFKYKQRKKQPHHHRPQLKEIRISLTTAQHDLDVRAKRVVEFLKKKDKVLVSMRLRGRQHGHADQGKEILTNFAKRFEDVGKVERAPDKDSGGKISVLLAPK